MEQLITVVDSETAQPNTSYPVEQFLKDRVPRGWHDLVRQLVCDLFDLGWDGRMLQINEKHGGLNFHLLARSLWGGTDAYFNYDAVCARIRRAEEDSFKFCEMCGEQGFLCRSGNLLKTLCTLHLDNRDGNFLKISTTTK